MDIVRGFWEGMVVGRGWRGSVELCLGRCEVMIGRGRRRGELNVDM